MVNNSSFDLRQQAADDPGGGGGLYAPTNTPVPTCRPGTESQASCQQFGQICIPDGNCWKPKPDPTATSTPTKKPDYSSCTSNSECQSNICQSSLCRPIPTNTPIPGVPTAIPTPPSLGTCSTSVTCQSSLGCYCPSSCVKSFATQYTSCGGIKGSLNTPCSPSSPCQPGLTCTKDTGDNTYVCKNLGAGGVVPTATPAKKGVNQICLSNTDCQSGLTCVFVGGNTKICKALATSTPTPPQKRANGQSCTSNTQCVSNLCRSCQAGEFCPDQSGKFCFAPTAVVTASCLKENAFCGPGSTGSCCSGYTCDSSYACKKIVIPTATPLNCQVGGFYSYSPVSNCCYGDEYQSNGRRYCKSSPEATITAVALKVNGLYCASDSECQSSHCYASATNLPKTCQISAQTSTASVICPDDRDGSGNPLVRTCTCMIGTAKVYRSPGDGCTGMITSVNYRDNSTVTLAQHETLVNAINTPVDSIAPGSQQCPLSADHCFCQQTSALVGQTGGFRTQIDGGEACNAISQIVEIVQTGQQAITIASDLPDYVRPPDEYYVNGFVNLTVGQSLQNIGRAAGMLTGYDTILGSAEYAYYACKDGSQADCNNAQAGLLANSILSVFQIVQIGASSIPSGITSIADDVARASTFSDNLIITTDDVARIDGMGLGIRTSKPSTLLTRIVEDDQNMLNVMRRVENSSPIGSTLDELTQSASDVFNAGHTGSVRTQTDSLLQAYEQALTDLKLHQAHEFDALKQTLLDQVASGNVSPDEITSLSNQLVDLGSQQQAQLLSFDRSDLLPTLGEHFDPNLPPGNVCRHNVIAFCGTLTNRGYEPEILSFQLREIGSGHAAVALTDPVLGKVVSDPTHGVVMQYADYLQWVKDSTGATPVGFETIENPFYLLGN